jgi:hypothetical protein
MIFAYILCDYVSISVHRRHGLLVSSERIVRVPYKMACCGPLPAYIWYKYVKTTLIHFQQASLPPEDSRTSHLLRTMYVLYIYFNLRFYWA